MHALIRFKKNGENSADFKLNDGISLSPIDENDIKYSKYVDAEYDTFLLTEDDINNKLAGASFRPPEGGDTSKICCRNLGRSTDGLSVR